MASNFSFPSRASQGVRCHRQSHQQEQREVALRFVDDVCRQAPEERENHVGDVTERLNHPVAPRVSAQADVKKADAHHRQSSTRKPHRAGRKPAHKHGRQRCMNHSQRDE